MTFTDLKSCITDPSKPSVPEHTAHVLYISGVDDQTWWFIWLID